jgi:hypothetical protein
LPATGRHWGKGFASILAQGDVLMRTDCEKIAEENEI